MGRPAGCIARHKYDFQFTLMHNKIRRSRSFAFSKFGGVEGARRAAEAYQLAESERLGLTRPTFSVTATDTDTPIEEQHARWLAAMTDGDGTVSMGEKKKLLHVSVAQSSGTGEAPESLQFIRDVLHLGTIYLSSTKNDRRHRKTWRPRYLLHIPAAQLESVLHILHRNCVIKADQAALGLEYVELMKSGYGPKHPKRIRIYRLLLHAKENYATVNLDTSRLNVHYIAGIFDSEGFLGICPQGQGKLKLHISQPSCPRLLEAISSYIHCGHVQSSTKLEVCGDNARDMLAWLLPHLHEKREQVEIALAWHVADAKATSKEERDRLRAEADTKLKHLKHMGTHTDPLLRNGVCCY